MEIDRLRFKIPKFTKLTKEEQSLGFNFVFYSIPRVAEIFEPHDEDNLFPGGFYNFTRPPFNILTGRVSFLQPEFLQIKMYPVGFLFARVITGEKW